MGALLGLIKQVDQFDSAAVAGFERAAIGAIHGAKAHVLKLHVGGHEACLAGDGKHLLKVQCLTLVDKVEHAVGV